MTPLPPQFLARPFFAHRGLHEPAAGRVENGVCAIRAAVAAGYGVEIDVQCSTDGVAMVFHDDDLDRLTARTGPIRATPAAALTQTPLVGGGGDTIPTLRQVLEVINGQVPLLIEIKDQDGAMGTNVGRLEAAVARDLRHYRGAVAVMSFNPHAVAAFAAQGGDVPVGLVTDAYGAEGWPHIAAARRAELAHLPSMAGPEISFISHNHTDLTSKHVAAFKATGRPVLCWTITSQTQATTATQIADAITFEGFRP